MPPAALAVLRPSTFYSERAKPLPPTVTDALSYALYFACGKTSGPKATRDYSPSPSALHGSQRLRYNDGKLSFFNVEVNAYFASVAADFIRHKLIERSKSFTFETVMSFSDKIELLRKAQSRGYRTYLYYVATEDPVINVSRVRYRVKMGGHSVPEDKIVSRYQRSLDLLVEAIQFTNRAYIFDNSTYKHIWLAEITDGHMLEMKTDLVPSWFKKALGSKFDIYCAQS